MATLFTQSLSSSRHYSGFPFRDYSFSAGNAQQQTGNCQRCEGNLRLITESYKDCRILSPKTGR